VGTTVGFQITTMQTQAPWPCWGCKTKARQGFPNKAYFARWSFAICLNVCSFRFSLQNDGDLLEDGVLDQFELQQWLGQTRSDEGFAVTGGHTTVEILGGLFRQGTRVRQ
jgi:hypothetical protein